MKYRYSVIEAIISLNPDARGGTSVKKDDDIDNCVITWKEGISEISKEDIKTEMDRLKKEYDAQDYSRKRKAEYPSVQDLVVALYDTDDKTAIDAKRAEIKLKYPKPQ